MAVVDRHKTGGIVCPGGMLQQCRSLIALGGMAQVGLDCRPYFMARRAMQRQLYFLPKIQHKLLDSTAASAAAGRGRGTSKSGNTTGGPAKAKATVDRCRRHEDDAPHRGTRQSTNEQTAVANGDHQEGAHLVRR